MYFLSYRVSFAGQSERLHCKFFCRVLTTRRPLWVLLVTIMSFYLSLPLVFGDTLLGGSRAGFFFFDALVVKKG